MATPLWFRVREWWADHVKSAQYPRPILVSPAREPFFNNAMPLYLRFGLVVLGLVLLLAAALVLFFVGLLVWAMITA